MERLPRVYDATNRYLRDLDRLTAEDLAVDTVLPGWTRAHVVAHLALHALGVSRALTGLQHGRRVSVYESDAERDDDIALTAKLPVDELRELSFDACGRLKASLESTTAWEEEVERTPGGPVFKVADLVDTRWREVEIHHVDLDIGYSPADWPADFATYVFEVVTWDRAETTDVVLRLPDRDVVLGRGGPLVEGTEATLAYWLLGRASGHGLAGELPTLGPWTRRTPAK